jgi:hypothetical protein
VLDLAFSPVAGLVAGACARTIIVDSTTATSVAKKRYM